MEPQNIFDWRNDHEPRLGLIYRNDFFNQINFVQYGLLRLLGPPDDLTVEVISTHSSKAVTLPVYRITIMDIGTITMRCDFQDWIVSVDLMQDVVIELYDLLKEKDKTEKYPLCRAKGFENEWLFEPYHKNKQQFTIRLESNNDLYVFLFLLGGKLNLRNTLATEQH